MQKDYSDVTIITLEPMRVASYAAKSLEPENDSIQFMKEWAKVRGLDQVAGVREFGFDVPVTEAESEQGLRGYESWITVGPDVQESDGVVIKNFQGGRYAVLRITEPFVDPFRLIPGGWERLWHWVKDNGHEFEHNYGLEELLEDEDGIYMNIFMPIK